jgi:hypothetical protein
MSLFLHDHDNPGSHRVLTIHTSGCKERKPAPRRRKLPEPISDERWHGPFSTLGDAQRTIGSFMGLIERRVHYCVTHGRP